eukprot:364806-Chlamydomonas_euryale.AAC.8
MGTFGLSEGCLEATFLRPRLERAEHLPPGHGGRELSASYSVAIAGQRMHEGYPMPQGRHTFARRSSGWRPATNACKM